MTSSSSASSSIGLPPAWAAAAASWRAISARRSAKEAITAPSAGQLAGVFVGIGEDDRIDRRFKAVAVRRRVLKLQAEDGERHDVAAVQQCDQAMRRADEIDAAPAVLASW